MVPAMRDGDAEPSHPSGETMFVDRSPRDDMVAYIEAMQPLHADLQRVLTQAAGYSLLVLTLGGRVALADVPVIAARGALATVRSQLDGVRVPVSARQHHDHVSAASVAIHRALGFLETCLHSSADDDARGELTRALRIATDHLRVGTKLLPGFELVDLSQACCAAHAARSPLFCH